MWVAYTITGVAVIVAAWVGNRKLNAIHVLVNSRLTEALTEIAELKAKLGGPLDDSP